MSYLNKDDDGLPRHSRPSLRQVNAIVDFMQKHPLLAQSKQRKLLSNKKVNKLWIEMSKMVNSIGDVKKSTKSWIKYWLDKRRYVIVKHRRLQIGKSNLKLSSLEKKILNICLEGIKKYKQIKREHSHNYYNGDGNDGIQTNFLESSESEEKYLNMIENMTDVMEKQAAAFTQMAQTWYSHSSAMDRLANASYQQAVAVGKLANSFEAIGLSVFDVKNAVLSIDNELKRSLTALSDQHNTHLFS